MDLQVGIDWLTNALYSYWLVYVLVGVGLWFTVRTGFVQVRLFPAMVRQVLSSREDAAGGISSFQAFAVGLASRVGTGNIAGVAVALTLGGSGAVFWMWVVAAVGMATALVEATLAQILRGAFGLDSALAGTAGGILAAVLNGTRRGLFSNEAGMGSAPNTAATATVSHPVKQGLIQSLGVFVDTMLVCSATACIVLSAGPEVYVPGETGSDAGAALTSAAVAHELGTWTTWPMTLLVFTFAFSSVLGNYSYAETNLTYLGVQGRALTALRTLVLAAVGVGALLALTTVWAVADIAMALMATVNLVAIVLLSRWATGALADYRAAQREGRADERFVGHGNTRLPGDVPGDVWAPGAHDGLPVADPVG